jgi:hypothetical protein
MTPRNWLRYIVADGGFCYVLQYHAPPLAAFFGSHSFADYVQMSNGSRSLPLLDLQTWVEKGIVRSRQEARSLARCLLRGQGARIISKTVEQIG